MLNMMGLGFSFGGKDAGLTKAIDSALGSVHNFTAGMANVSTAMSRLAEQGRDPTTDFEASLQANNVVTTKMGVNLGKTGKALTAFSSATQSVALEMNRSVSEAGEAIGQFERLGDVSTKGGIDSAKTLMKLAEVSDQSSTVWTNSFRQMSKLEGMTAKSTQGVADAFIAFGQSAGDASLAAHALPDLMQQFTAQSAQLRKGLPGVAVEEFAKQTAALALSFHAVTKSSAADSLAFSKNIGSAMISASHSFGDLKVGIGDTLPGLPKELSVVTGDVKKSFDLLKQGPQGFTEGLRDMVGRLKGDKGKIQQLMNWVGGRLGQEFGPEQSDMLVNYLSKATDQTTKQGDAIKSATGNLQKYAQEGWKSGRTAAEAMALSENLFVTRIRSINNSAWEFAKTAGNSFKLLGGEIVHFGSDKGPVGTLTRSLVDLDHKGLVGLLPDKLQGTAVALGGFTKRLGKTLEGILNPLNAVESGLMLFGVAMTDAFMHTKQSLPFMDRLGLAFESVANDAVSYLETLPDKITSMLNNAASALNSFFGKSSSSSKWSVKIRGWWDRIINVFTALGPIMTRIKKFASEFWTGLTATMTEGNPDQDAVGVKAGKWLRHGWDVAVDWFQRNVWPEIKKFGNDFWVGITDSLSTEKADSDSVGFKIGKWIHSAFDTALTWVEDNLPDLLWKLFKILVKEVWKGVKWAATELQPQNLVKRAFTALTSDTPSDDEPTGFAASPTISKSVITPAAPAAASKHALKQMTDKSNDKLAEAINNPEHAQKALEQGDKQIALLDGIRTALKDSQGGRAGAPATTKPAPGPQSPSMTKPYVAATTSGNPLTSK